MLCVDKTGTLTLNQMTVRRILASGQVTRGRVRDRQDLPEPFHETVEFAILASQRDPFDPMEKAFRQLGERYLAQTEHLHDDWTLVREYPLSDRLLAMSQVWKSRETEDYVIAAKGAPEAIADLCHLDDRRVQTLSADVAAMADDGLRVLGVARATLPSARRCPASSTTFAFEFLGLVGLDDPVRPDGRRGGPRVRRGRHPRRDDHRRLSGHRPQHRARRSASAPESTVVTGAELDAMDDAELRAPRRRRPASSRASCPSRSCGWSRRSRRTARSWR